MSAQRIRLLKAGLFPVLKGERHSLAEGFGQWVPVLGKDESMTKSRDHHPRGRAGTGKIYACDSKSQATGGGGML